MKEKTPLDSVIKIPKFRRGKKFQEAYFDIGMTNQNISNLEIEIKCHLRNGNKIEASSKKRHIKKLKDSLKKYDPETFDLTYRIPQISGWYIRQSRRDILK